MFAVKRLKLSDVTQMTRLLQSQMKIGKQKLNEDELEQAVSRIVFAMSTLESSVVFYGAYDSQGLHSYMCQQFKSCFQHDWVMALLVTKAGTAFADFEKNGHDKLWETAVRVGHQHGYNTFRWSMPVKWSRTESRTRTKSPTIMNMHIEPYLTVPAGELPQSELDRWVFGERPKPYDVLLKRAFDTRFPAKFHDYAN